MTKYYEKNDTMVGRQIADEFILVPVKQGVGHLDCMYVLNDVGRRIWELLDNGSTTIEKIATVIVREYEVEIPQAEADTLEFLEQMKEIGAVMEKAEVS